MDIGDENRNKKPGLGPRAVYIYRQQTEQGIGHPRASLLCAYAIAILTPRSSVIAGSELRACCVDINHPLLFSFFLVQVDAGVSLANKRRERERQENARCLLITMSNKWKVQRTCCGTTATANVPAEDRHGARQASMGCLGSRLASLALLSASLGYMYVRARCVCMCPVCCLCVAGARNPTY
jgi:hypothetical protein